MSFELPYLFIYLAEPGLSCSMRALLVAACRLLVASCGIQFPDQGLNPDPLHWELTVLTTGPLGKSLHYLSLNLFFKFIYFWLHWVFVTVCRLSLVVASGGCSSLRCAGFSLRWLLLLQITGSRHGGFSSCGTRGQQLWLVGSRTQAQQLWRTGLVAPWHVGSSRTRARTCVPSIGKRILNH